MCFFYGVILSNLRLCLFRVLSDISGDLNPLFFWLSFIVRIGIDVKYLGCHFFVFFITVHYLVISVFYSMIISVKY